MYRPPLRPTTSGGGEASGYSRSHPTMFPNAYFFQNPNINLANGFQNQGTPNYPLPAVQIPGTPFPQLPSFQNATFVPPIPQVDPKEALRQLEGTVAKAHQDLLQSGESISAWKVSQSALLSLGVNSWNLMGFQIQDIPYLRQLMVTEGKVEAFIHSFVGSRRITTVHDLDIAICTSEGVDRFDELGLGMLVRHSLVQQYFSVPPDATEVLKITTEDVIKSVVMLIEKGKRNIKAESVLKFLKEKHSVNQMGMLGVRIRDLGSYIIHICESKKAENARLSASFESISRNFSDNKEKAQTSNLSHVKSVSDKRFQSISERMKTFSAAQKDPANTHIRFDSSDEDDSEKDTVQEIQDQILPHSESNCSRRVSSCPYPSTYEEMTRLGVKSPVAPRKSLENRKAREADIIIQQTKKRKSESCSELDLFVQKVKQKKVDLNFPPNLENYLMLDSGATKKFMLNWKEACSGHSILEVLDMMLDFYEDEVKKNKRKQLCSMLEIFSSYPGIGLLNVAVTCIKSGMLALQHLGKKDIANPRCSEGIKTEGKKSRGLELQSKTVSDADVIQKISSYFEGYQLIPRDQEIDQKSSYILKQLHACEERLVEQFSVQEFSILGHGSFLGFLTKNLSEFPIEKQLCSSGNIGQKPTMIVSMHQDQLLHILSKAGNQLSDQDDIESILSLLRKQFPTISFYIEGNQPERLLLDSEQTSISGKKSESIIFSSTLLNKHQSRNSPFQNEHLLSYNSVKIDSNNFLLLSNITAEDALQCLCKAPMLSDLRSWSHWDILYAPKLGSLLEWLLNDANSKDLACIATSDGKFIRIDPAPSIDDFLEAAIQGSSFQTALKLLSLLSLYGGVNGFPLSLAKHFAQNAMEVMIRNSVDCSLLCTRRRVSLASSSSELQGAQTSHFGPVSGFIIDCLWYLPPEFRSFAAEILISGLCSIVKDAYLVVLQECKDIDHRLMLHDIGLSLGITKWIDDYKSYCSSDSSDVKMSNSSTRGNLLGSNLGMPSVFSSDVSESIKSDSHTTSVRSVHSCVGDERLLGESPGKELSSVCKKIQETHGFVASESSSLQDAITLIESIRREEFGLDTDLQQTESYLLDKQHARLGRALQCLSQELYSHDSHLLLELIQNADDNSYPTNVAPTLVFILQADSIVLLNNEYGFSAQNIRALCDIGNSTKKRSSSGYIGHKGIGFKSVFRVSDAPEIHSNGFHVKFDISNGQIGFVLPTIISPCDVNLYAMQVPYVNQSVAEVWNTCIVLPFRPKIKEQAEVSSVASLFCDLHPSLLLFLHRLQCIQLKNTLNDTLTVMRKETLKDGIVRVSIGDEKLTWLVVSDMLKVELIRSDVETTEIALAFTLQESETENGEYMPHLSQQPVFAFLPLRQYGLKFILQGDFVLPSSREEVDGDSAWNQWLLSQYPILFVGAESYFSRLSCFKESPGKAVSTFLSFVPLPGEVQGFFSPLPSMIISKLRMSNCLLLEGYDMEWAPPCRALGGWDEQARFLVPDNLLKQYLGLGYLRKDIVLTDTLAKALGIRCYGSQILVDIMKSVCQVDGGAMSLSFDWLSSCLVVIGITLSTHCNAEREFELIKILKGIPFIPLSNGSFSSLAQGPIWLPCEYSSVGGGGIFLANDFPHLYSKLRTIDPNFLATEMSYIISDEEKKVDNLTRTLLRVGVQQLFAHEIIKTHILHELASDGHAVTDKHIMIEYLSFVMLHFQYDVCLGCSTEKEKMLLELQNKCIVLTNHGFKCPIKEPIHFSKDFGNHIDITRLIDHDDAVWNEVDNAYLKYPSSQSLTVVLKNWREFLLSMGLTDFVQVVHTGMKTQPSLTICSPHTCDSDVHGTSGILISDWESPQLIDLLSVTSSKRDSDRSRYLLEVLDDMWDSCYAEKTVAYLIDSGGLEKSVQSSFLKGLQNSKWISSTENDGFHFAKDIYYDCEAVRSVLGTFAPYAIPQVKSKKFLKDIGFKCDVTVDDALKLLQRWSSCSTFVASTPQMSKFYNYLYDNAPAFKGKRLPEFAATPWIFVPIISESKLECAVHGSFFLPDDVYWHDPTGCFGQMQERMVHHNSRKPMHVLHCKALAGVYPGLHKFFVSACGVQETPHLANYMEILLYLSRVALPSQTGSSVLRVLSNWADDLNAGILKPEKLLTLKEFLCNPENTILPTMQDTWVSLHPKFGIVCWCDDEELKAQIQCCADISVKLLYFGELSDVGNKDVHGMLPGKHVTLMQNLGVPALSEILYREAIFYGTTCNKEEILLVNWILPFAQRYIFKLFPSRYQSLTKMLQEKLNQLQVFIVEKLYYTYKIKGQEIILKNRYECKCLLQGNILYVAQTSDSHTIFLEVSRLLFKGSVNLQLANFLHMITTMAKSGSSQNQIEYFIVNNQKIPELPSEEPRWMLGSLSSLLHGQSPANHTAKINVTNESGNPNYTTTGWQPSCPLRYTFEAESSKNNPNNWPTDFSVNMKSQSSTLVSTMDVSVSMDAYGIGVGDYKPNPSGLKDSKDTRDKFPSFGSIDGLGKSELDPKAQLKDHFIISTNSSMMPAGFRTTHDRLSLTASNEEESYRTGRLGEAAAYRYFSERFNRVTVKWVNKDVETGLPYDLSIGEGEDGEYIEVKTTKSKMKNWFSITTREWQFAVDKGDAFSIARVVLLDNDAAEVTILRNPVKLLQKNMLNLAIMMP